MAKAGNNPRLGAYVTRSVAGERYKAFVPPSLPPTPQLEMARLYKPLDRAMKALGRIDALATLLPNIGLFLYMYVRKEALLSSQIEGTQSSLSDLLLFENDESPGVPVDDGLPCRKWSKSRVRIGPLLNGEWHAASAIYGRADHREAA